MTPAEATNIRLTGVDFEPRGTLWALAGESLRRAYWRHVADFAMDTKRREIRAGIGKDGRKLKPVKKTSRPDGAKGPPLIPHYATSRTQRNLAKSSTASSATLFWRGGWARILGYHAYKHGARALPVRNTIGISPKGLRAIAQDGRDWWDRQNRVSTPPAPKPAPRPTTPRPAPVPKPGVAAKPLPAPRFVPSPAASLHGDVTVRVRVDVIEASIRRDPSDYVGPGGKGGAPGRYANVEQFVRAGKPIEQPRVALGFAGEVVIRDGRHRFAVLRDLGVKEIAVSVAREDAARFRTLYGATPNRVVHGKPPKGPVRATRKIRVYQTRQRPPAGAP